MIDLVLFSKITGCVTIGLVLIGLFGNLLMYVVYSQPTLSKLSVSSYLRAMALTNILVNIMSINTILLNFGIILNVQSEFMCKTISYLLFTFGAVSSWLEVAASLDRLVTIVYPTRFALVQKPLFSSVVILIILVYNFGYYSQAIVAYQLVRLNVNLYFCVSDLEAQIESVDFFNSTAAPFLVMLVSSIVTLVGVIKSRRRFNLTSNNPINRRKKLKDIKFGVTLIALNISFILLNTPRRLYFFLNALQLFGHDIFIFSYWIKSVVFLNELYFAASFYIQACVNSLVRRELMNFKSRIVNGRRGGQTGHRTPSQRTPQR